MKLLDIAKQELIRSNADHRHPFKLLTLATLDNDSGYPQLRTVVKRHIDLDFNVLVYTDSRSPKIEQIHSNSKSSLLWYHPKKKLQIRMECIATVVSQESQLYKDHSDRVKHSNSVSDYTTVLSPGSATVDREVEYADKIHFSLIQLVPAEIEVLQLNRDQHERALYTKVNNLWQEINLVP